MLRQATNEFCSTQQPDGYNGIWISGKYPSSTRYLSVNQSMRVDLKATQVCVNKDQIY